jgi:hypothetical protein
MKCQAFDQTDAILTPITFIIVNHNHTGQVKAQLHKTRRLTSNVRRDHAASQVSKDCNEDGRSALMAVKTRNLVLFVYNSVTYFPFQTKSQLCLQCRDLRIILICLRPREMFMAHSQAVREKCSGRDSIYLLNSCTISSQKPPHTHTHARTRAHTHTHIYIYIYILMLQA